MKGLVLMKEVEVEGQDGERSEGDEQVVVEGPGGGVGEVEEGLGVVVLLDDALSRPEVTHPRVQGTDAARGRWDWD